MNDGMTYYVVVGRLVSNNQWEQRYIVPFDNISNAEKYKDEFLGRNRCYEALIASSNVLTEREIYD